MPYAVRPATQADSPGVVATIKAVYDEYGFSWDPAGYHADLYDLEAHYIQPGHPFWVAVNEHQAVVGTVALELFPAHPGTLGELFELDGLQRIAGTDCGLDRLYVHPEARRQGIAGALCQAVLTAARQSGKAAMEIWSDKRFTAAHALYEKLGARPVGDRICDDPDESPERGLLLPLQGK